MTECRAEIDLAASGACEANAAGLPSGGECYERQIRALELASTLACSLEPLELVQAFSDALQNDVPHDGLRLWIADLDLDYALGRRGAQPIRLPLVLDEHELGALEVSRDRSFGRQETEMLAELAVSLLYPLRNAALYQGAVRLAFRDPLTGLDNRAALDAGLAQQLDLASRHGSAVSLLVVDTDKFKQINDGHGHIVGDRVLKAVAQAIVRSVRTTDLVHRYGGDEFVVVLGNTGAAAAERVAERIRAAVEALRIHEGNVHLMVSISIGLAERRAGEDFVALFRRADAALYRAKRAGRNQVAAA